jgi:hypothetical protein
LLILDERVKNALSIRKNGNPSRGAFADERGGRCTSGAADPAEIRLVNMHQATAEGAGERRNGDSEAAPNTIFYAKLNINFFLFYFIYFASVPFNLPLSELLFPANIETEFRLMINGVLRHCRC